MWQIYGGKVVVLTWGGLIDISSKVNFLNDNLHSDM
jgi:hypothetical protein